MSIKIYPDTKVYVVVPANTATGGPELLHQLVYHLRKDLGINAYMYYLPDNHPNPVHQAYQRYNNPFVRTVDDKSNNLIIVPEIYEMISILGKYRNIRKVVWWLSVDNFYISKLFSSVPMRLINVIFKSLLGYPLFKFPALDFAEISLKIYKSLDLKKDTCLKSIDLHLVQSEYAKQHLIRKGFSNIEYLSDYLNENFLKLKADFSKKKNIVVFNPRKGLKFTKKIINYAPNIKFIPIENMTREEVIALLQKAKVYIDFGNHPGKDRIPREAAILGCCVITGKRGSANYEADVPIPASYKFNDKLEEIPRIVKKIKDCFDNYQVRYKDFDSYRKKILEEPKKFLSDLRKVFVRTYS